MAFNKLEDTNALLLYRVGPVLMCSPTLQVESVIVPPAISRANAVSDDEPGMFRSMYGMVRVVDLRVRFGVDAAQRKQPGQIVIVEVVGGHAGFWVDEIEDVIAFPQTGWSQVPSHVPGSVFSRTLLEGNDIRLYAEFDRLDSFKASGYLREHIRSLQQAAKTEKASTEFKKTPVQAVTLPADSPTPAETEIKTDAKPDSHVIGDSTALNVSESLTKKPADKPMPAHSPARQPEPPASVLNARQSSASHRPSSAGRVMPHRQTEAELASDRRVHHPSPPVQNSHKAATTLTTADLASRAGGDSVRTQPTPSVSAQDSSAAGWLWWFVPLLLLLAVLFMFVQNSRLLQGLVAENEPPTLQSRVSLQDDKAPAVVVKTASNHVDQDTPEMPVDKTATVADSANAQSAVQLADELAGVVYIEPETGDLTITVNDYQDEYPAEDQADVVNRVEEQLTQLPAADASQASVQQAGASEREAGTEQQQAAPLIENETADSGLIATEKKQDQPVTQVSADEMEKSSAAEAEAAKPAEQKSRRLQHIVVKGDTLWSITGRYINKPWLYPEIARLSNIDNPHLIYPGQRVIIVLNYKDRSE